jgi:hypothetical protein
MQSPYVIQGTFKATKQNVLTISGRVLKKKAQGTTPYVLHAQ